MEDESSFLNEVLSLNAQELIAANVSHVRHSVLNEVLSLNAQEFASARFVSQSHDFPQ